MPAGLGWRPLWDDLGVVTGRDGELPSYDELAAAVVRLTARLDELAVRTGELEADNVRLVAEKEALRAENTELRRRLGLTSKNSSKPPSSEGLDKPPATSLRGRSGRKPGKQPGSAGTALSQVPVADEEVDHYPPVCGGCGDGLDPAAGEADDPVVRQVFDVPEARVRVTAHLLHALTCPGCGASTRAIAPVGVSAPAVYGPTVTMLAAYLAAQHHIPVARVVEILADLAGIEVSLGWVMTACARMATAVEPANEAIKDAIAAAPVAHFDETVTRVAGRNHWLHAAATGRLTAYHVDEHGRAVASMTAFGILPRFAGSPCTTRTAATTPSPPARTRCAMRISCARRPGSVSTTRTRVPTAGPTTWSPSSATPTAGWRTGAIKATPACPRSNTTTCPPVTTISSNAL
jgi:transposase